MSTYSRLLSSLLLVRWYPLQCLWFWQFGFHWCFLCQSGRDSQCEYCLWQDQVSRCQATNMGRWSWRCHRTWNVGIVCTHQKGRWQSSKKMHRSLCPKLQRHYMGKEPGKSSTKGLFLDSPMFSSCRRLARYGSFLLPRSQTDATHGQHGQKWSTNEWERWICGFFGGTWFINESWISQLVSRISWNVMIPIPSIFVLCFWMAWHWQNEIRWYKNPGSSGGWSEVSSPHREVIYAAMGSSFFFEQIQRIQKNPKWLAKDWRKGKK